MRFVKRDNLKTGMRLARPIYNKTASCCMKGILS